MNPSSMLGEEGKASDLCRDQNLSICAAAWLLPTCKSFANWHPTAHSSHPTSFLQSRHSNDQPGSKHCKKRLNGSMFKCGPIYKSIDVSLWPNIEPFSPSKTSHPATMIGVECGSNWQKGQMMGFPWKKLGTNITACANLSLFKEGDQWPQFLESEIIFTIFDPLHHNFVNLSGFLT